MIIFLYGSDTYRRDRKRDDIIAAYYKKHSALALQRFDCESEHGRDQFKDFIKNRSLFDPVRCAVVRGINAMEGAEEIRWLRGLLDAPDVVVIAFSDSKPPKPLQFLLQAPVTFQEFPVLEGIAYHHFVTEEAARRGVRISDAELAGLAMLYRGDTWGLVTELDKLSLSSDSRFTIHDSRIKKDFFALVKEVAYGRGTRILSALEELLSAEDHAKIFNVLAALVSGTQKIRMADYDVAIKSGALDYETALTDFALLRS